MVTMPDSLPVWLRELYPFSPRSFRTPYGAQLSYLDEGTRSDEIVLMVHGNPTWSFFYRTLVRSLAPKFRCIVPDHIGMGLSEKPQDYTYTLARRIDDLEALVKSLGVRRIHLVVHDWGGAIGFGLAARMPETIGRIVILNTAAFRSRSIPFRIAVCRNRSLGTLLVRGLNGFAGPAVRMAMHRRSLDEGERRGFLFPYDSWAHRVAVDAFVKDIPLESAHVSYATLTTVEEGLPQFSGNRISIVWGGQDFCFNDEFLDRWKTIFPQARVTRIADAGHYVLDDAGEEAITACIAGIEY